MFPFSSLLVRQHERGLLFKNSDFQSFLPPGKYHYFDPLLRLSLQTYDLTQPEFTHELREFLCKNHPEAVQQYFNVVDLGVRQVGILYKNNHLADILPPNSKIFYWRGVVDIRIELFDLAAEIIIPKELTELILHGSLEGRYCHISKATYSKEVPEHHIGLLYLDGKYIQTLHAGLHACWQFYAKPTIYVVDLRLQELGITGQEILTKDKVSLRVNLTLNYMFQDAVKAFATIPKPEDYLYKVMQLGLRAIIGTHSLDAILEDKTAINEQLTINIQSRMADVGITIKSVGIKDIILPGEMRDLLNKVVEAEKAAQANIIRRREETAATRSLLNTAKVMEDNQVALRLKELEVLEKLSEKISSLSVYGGFDGLLRELVKIK